MKATVLSNNQTVIIFERLQTKIGNPLDFLAAQVAYVEFSRLVYGGYLLSE
jgi:hypothetical protein